MAHINYRKLQEKENFYGAEAEKVQKASGRYSYEIRIKSDICLAIRKSFKAEDFEDIEDADSLMEYLNDELWTNDLVTGNNIAYRGGIAEAEEYVIHNLDLLAIACTEWDMTKELADHLRDSDFKWMDVTIRCYLLNESIWDVVTDLVKDGTVTFTMSYFEKASKKYSEDVVDFIYSLGYDGAYSEIDLEDAKTDISNWLEEGVEVPEDLSPEAYVELWNALVWDDEEDILCMKH